MGVKHLKLPATAVLIGTTTLGQIEMWAVEFADGQQLVAMSKDDAHYIAAAINYFDPAIDAIGRFIKRFDGDEHEDASAIIYKMRDVLAKSGRG